MSKKPLLLVIMDGIGIDDPGPGNAFTSAHLETLTDLTANNPTVTLKASGEAVGIPKGDMGNSEVGHNAIGAGQIILQGSSKAQQMFQTGEVFQTQTWHNVIDQVKSRNSTLHIMGLFSDGNVHADINHCFAMMKQAQQEGIQRIRVHAIFDGRDVPPESAEKYIDMFEDYVRSLGNPDYRIASGGGRMNVWMDRYENDWGMIELGWHTVVLGEGRQFEGAKDAVLTLRKEFEPPNDQYLQPFVIADNGQPIGTVNDGDAFVFYNFRADRAIEGAMAFTYDDFKFFDRIRRPDIFFVGMMEYDADTHVPANTLVPLPEIHDTLNEFLIANNVSQYAISETVKYGHVTYYFDGNSYVDQDSLHTYVEVPSEKDTEKIVTRPWMKAAEICDKLIDALRSDKYDFLRVNFANGDMVGHFGELEPGIVACESVDLQIKRLQEVIDELDGTMIITADHGNVEELLDDKGQQMTSHTTNPVLCIFYNQNPKFITKNYTVRESRDLGLTNLAATITTLLDLKPNPIWRASILKPKK